MNINKIKPLNRQVLIKPIEEEKVTNSGIVLNNIEEKYSKGTVIATDTKKIQVNQIVLYSKFNNTPVKEYMLVNCKNILAVLEE